MPKRQFEIAQAREPAIVGGALRLERRSLPLVVRTRADIEALSALPKALKRLPPDGLIVDIPGLDQTARDAFRQEARKYIRACGCAAGGATFLISAAVCVARSTSLAFGGDWSGAIVTIGIGLILVLLLTAVAKFLGLGFARRRFRRACARLDASLSARSPSTEPSEAIHDV